MFELHLSNEMESGLLFVNHGDKNILIVIYVSRDKGSLRKSQPDV